jgi:hypothetical protein
MYACAQTKRKEEKQRRAGCMSAAREKPGMKFPPHSFFAPGIEREKTRIFPKVKVANIKTCHIQIGKKSYHVFLHELLLHNQTILTCHTFLHIQAAVKLKHSTL